MAEETLPNPPASPFQVIVDNFNRMSPRQRMAGAAALAFGIALAVGVWLWNQEPPYAVLFSGVEEKDGGAIVTALQQQNIPYRIENGGTTIMVPGARANELRLTLAAQGLPRGGSVGFELLESQKLGLSQFHEQVNYQRALEGELARTIQSIGAVAGARIHLAIPKQSAFLRNEQKPTASVVLNLRPGRKLDQAQIAGIVHLVASSVPELSADQVSVIDQNGNLLARKRKQGGVALDDTQLEYVRNVEESYAARIQKILDPVLGAGNFRAQVMADVDFDASEQTSETFKPNPSPTTAVRSQQTAENIANQPGPVGVPGALSNQPPVPATAPITNPAIPGQVAQSGPASIPLNSNKTATINYEVDKTVQHVKRAVGQVRRLSVALVVNNKSEKDAKGNIKAAPLSEAEVRKINDLVREAVGYNEKRGDTINVTNTAFTDPAKEEVLALPIYQDPEMISMAKEAARWLLLLIVILLVYKKVIQPLMKAFAPPPVETPSGADAAGAIAAYNAQTEGEEGSGMDEDIPPEVLELELAKMSFEKKLARAREVAAKDPKIVAQMIKEWMSGGSSGEGR